MIHYLQTVPSPPILPVIDPHTLLPVSAPLMPNEQSLAEVLLGFFAHYAELPMDQALCIATARFLPRPEAWMSDATERFCIIDPLSPGEDLGRNLTTALSYRLRREFLRAHSELMSGTKLEAMMNDPAFLRRQMRRLAAETPEAQARARERKQAKAQVHAEARARGEAKAQARAQAQAQAQAAEAAAAETAAADLRLRLHLRVASAEVEGETETAANTEVVAGANAQAPSAAAAQQLLLPEQFSEPRLRVGGRHGGRGGRGGRGGGRSSPSPS